LSNFTEHSANERTFLAWIRTAIAVTAFGFVLEKFNLFILALTATASARVAKAIRTDRLSGPIGRYEGLAFMLSGLVLIGLGYWRFARNEKLIDGAEPRRVAGAQAEVAVSAILFALVQSS
jgi:putative membrane protein